MTIGLTPDEHQNLAYRQAIQAWEESLKRPDLDERARVGGALLAYQRQLDACATLAMQPDTRTQDEKDYDMDRYSAR